MPPKKRLALSNRTHVAREEAERARRNERNRGYWTAAQEKAQIAKALAEGLDEDEAENVATESQRKRDRERKARERAETARALAESPVQDETENGATGSSSASSSVADVSLSVTQVVSSQSNVTEASSPVSSIFSTASRLTSSSPLTSDHMVHVGDNCNPLANDRASPFQKSVVNVDASPVRNIIQEAPPQNNVTDHASPTPVSSVFESASHSMGSPLTGANKVVDEMAATKDHAHPPSLSTQKPVKVITSPDTNKDNFSFVNASNVCDIILAAYELNNSELKQKCLETIVANKEVIGREKIGTLPSSILRDIIFDLM